MTAQDDQTANTTGSTEGVIEAVRELITMMSRGGISELDLTTGDVSIRLRCGVTDGTTAVVGTVPASEADQSIDALEDAGHVISAPMIGTYYAAPAPGEPPFVQVGDRVESGQVIGIIEAMKIMNEIVADRAGSISEILVENAQPVEYGSPLIRVIETEAPG